MYNCSLPNTFPPCYNRGTCTRQIRSAVAQWVCVCKVPGDSYEADGTPSIRVAFPTCFTKIEIIQRTNTLTFGAICSFLNVVVFVLCLRGLYLLHQQGKLRLRVQTVALGSLLFCSLLRAVDFAIDPYGVNEIIKPPTSLLLILLPDVFQISAYNLVLAFFRQLLSRSVQGTLLTSRTIIRVMAVSWSTLLIVCIVASVLGNIEFYFIFYAIYLTIFSFGFLFYTIRVDRLRNALRRVAADTLSPVANRNGVVTPSPPTEHKDKDKALARRSSSAAPGRLSRAKSAFSLSKEATEKRFMEQNAKITQLAVANTICCIVIIILLAYWAMNLGILNAFADVALFMIVHWLMTIWGGFLVVTFWPREIATASSPEPDKDEKTRALRRKDSHKFDKTGVTGAKPTYAVESIPAAPADTPKQQVQAKLVAAAAAGNSNVNGNAVDSMIPVPPSQRVSDHALHPLALVSVSGDTHMHGNGINVSDAAAASQPRDGVQVIVVKEL